MILVGLLYHAYLYVFGFERTRIRMSDGGVFFWVPEPLEKVNRRFTDALQTRELIAAHRHNRRMSRVVLNPMQMVYWENLFRSERV